MTLTERFAALFAGNPEVHGRGDHSPYSIGGPPDIGAHLQFGGHAAVGVYPIWQNMVHWGCVDIDEDDVSHPVNLQLALQTLHIRSVIEVSRSKGYHVWVFLPDGEVIEARKMRRALQVACQLSDAPAREVNPKQEYLAPGKVGNYVRLPYPGVLNDDGPNVQRFALWGNGCLNTLHDLGDALEYAEHRVNDPFSGGPLDKAAQLWKPPAPQQYVAINVDLHDVVERGLSRSVVERLNELPLTKRVMLEGEGDGCDRSKVLTHLAYLAQEGRFTPSETLQILIEADLGWAHKYIERDHSDRELRRIVQRVFG